MYTLKGLEEFSTTPNMSTLLSWYQTVQMQQTFSSIV